MCLGYFYSRGLDMSTAQTLAKALALTPLTKRAHKPLIAIPNPIFAPGLCGVRVGNYVWVGNAASLTEHLIVLDTAHGLAVFDLRLVELLEIVDG
jgi:hypothetical protein